MNSNWLFIAYFLLKTVINYLYMKKIIALSLVVTSFTTNSNAGYVQGHYNKNGQYTEGHYRTNPDSYQQNNYSYQGSVNPYTRQVGRKNDRNGF